MSSKSERKTSSGRSGGAAAARGDGHAVGTGRRVGGGNKAGRNPQSQGVKSDSEEPRGGSGGLGRQPGASGVTGVAHSLGQVGRTTPTKEPQLELPRENLLDEDRSSSSSGSEVNSSVSQRADEPMRNAVAALQQREREVARLQQQLREQAARLQQLSLGEHSPAAASESACVHGAVPHIPIELEEESAKLPAVRPAELSYTGASAGTALEDWLFKLGQLFSQTRSCRPESAWQARMQVAQLYWDRDMSIWWSGQQEVAAAAGAPIQSWTAFVAALRKQFVSIGDSQLARADLLTLRMKADGERGRLCPASGCIWCRAQAVCWTAGWRPCCCCRAWTRHACRLPVAAVSRKERAAGAAGMSFAQMRAELTMEAALEPRLTGYGSGSSANSGGGSGSSSNSGARGATNIRQHRINALREQADALEEGGDERRSERQLRDSPSVHRGRRRFGSLQQVRRRGPHRS